MKPSQVAESIRTLYDKRRPVFIWGAPGAGKSAVVHQTCKDLDLEMRDIRLSMLDPTDLKGFPIADMKAQAMRWLQADFLPTDPKSKGILFFDEANSAPKSVEAPMYQLTLDGKLGDYRLPDGWSIVMAGNRETDRAIANRMSSALQNRLIHIDYEINLDDLCTWAIKQGKIETSMIAFWRFRPSLIHAFDANSKAWPSPRTWDFANQIAHSGLSRDTEFELLKGTVGEAAAGEYAAFMNVYRDLPSVDSILANPDKAQKPSSPDAMFAITTALAEKTKKDNYDRLMRYIERFEIEYQVVYIRDCVRREAPIENSKTFIKWSMDNADVLS